jgi:transposase
MSRERLRVTDSDRHLLRTWIRAGTTPQRVVRRARIVLLSGEGHAARDIGERLGVSTHTVSLWRRRFQVGGSSALMRDAPGRGRKVTVTADADARLRTLLATPPPGRRWTVRLLATNLGMSRASVHRVLKAAKLTLTSESAGEVGTSISPPQPTPDTNPQD